MLIDPFRVGAGAGFQLAVFDVARDTPIEAQWVTAPRDAVLLRADGSAIAKAVVSGLRPSGAQVDWGRTDDDGRYRLRHV